MILSLLMMVIMMSRVRRCVICNVVHERRSSYCSRACAEFDKKNRITKIRRRIG
jgi:hypothetical protein